MRNPPLTLFPEVVTHCQGLVQRGDRGLSDDHRAAIRQVSGWIRGRIAQGMPADLVVVCTGNSRRSILGSTLGNIAAALGGHSTVRFFSGGTAPSAFNPRTIKTLQEIGVQVEEQPPPAPSGSAGEPNPRYLVRWGSAAESQTVEFSKRYDDPTNPQQGYCAIMVCTDADENCPLVFGASLRVSMPFDDPQDSDGQPTEAAAYAERRDQIGRAMLSLLRP